MRLLEREERRKEGRERRERAEPSFRCPLSQYLRLCRLAPALTAQAQCTQKGAPHPFRSNLSHWKRKRGGRGFSQPLSFSLLPRSFPLLSVRVIHACCRLGCRRYATLHLLSTNVRQRRTDVSCSARACVLLSLSLSCSRLLRYHCALSWFALLEGSGLDVPLSLRHCASHRHRAPPSLTPAALPPWVP